MTASAEALDSLTEPSVLFDPERRSGVIQMHEAGESRILDVTSRDRRFLVRVADSQPKKLDVEVVDDEQVRITPTHCAGLIGLPEGPPLYVRSKISGTKLLHLLEYSDSEVDTLEHEAPIDAGTENVELLAALFADELEEVLRRGPSKEYRTRTESRDVIRGRLDLTRQLRKRGPGSPSFECTYEELSRDTLLNQTVLYAAWAVLGAVDEPQLQRRIRQQVNRLRRTVTLRKVSFQETEQITTTRLNDHYADLLRLAKLIIRNVYVEDIGPGSSAGYTMMLYMPGRFQDAVESAVSAVFSGATVRVAGASKLETFVSGDFDFEPEPDVVVQRDGEPELVIDAKWKDIETDRNGNLSPKDDDLYQVIAYQQYLQVPGVLVYPGERSGVVADSSVQNGYPLYLAELPVETSTDNFEAYVRKMDDALGDLPALT